MKKTKKILAKMLMVVMMIVSIGTVNADTVTNKDTKVYSDVFENYGVAVSKDAEFEMVTAVTDSGIEVDALQMTESKGNITKVTVLMTCVEDVTGEISYVDTEVSTYDAESRAGGTRYGVTGSAYYYTASANGGTVYRPYLLEVVSTSTTSFNVQYVAAGARFTTSSLEMVNGGGSHTIQIQKTSPTANYVYSQRKAASYYYYVRSGFVECDHYISFQVGNNATAYVSLPK